MEDLDLESFDITVDHEMGKIDLIKKVQQMSTEANGGPLALFASAWSAPGWMKESGVPTKGGKLKGEPGKVVPVCACLLCTSI